MSIVQKINLFSKENLVSHAQKINTIERIINYANPVLMEKFSTKKKIHANVLHQLHFGMKKTVLLAIIHNILI